MRLKRFALRGLIILFVAVALCMFFARTIQTITTAKVELVTASTGRFEDTMTFDATVEFPDKEEIIVEEAQDTPITVGKIYVRPGHYVEAGDTIFTAVVPNFEDKMEELRKEYDTKSDELLKLDMDNRKLSKESRQNELYDAMMTAQDTATDLIYDARFLALDQGISLTGDVSTWTQQLALHDGEIPKEVTTAVNKAQKAQSAFETARADFFAILDNRQLRVRDEVFQYINDRNAAIDAMEDLTTQMIELATTVNGLEKVVAPHSGYIVSVDVTEGAEYNGGQKAFVMSKEGSVPVLMADYSYKRTVAEGTRADITSEVYGNQRSEVIEMVTNMDGTKQLKIAMPEAYLDTSSSAIRRFVSDGSVPVSVTYRAKQSSTLLPPSAVRDAGDGTYFIYLIENNWGGFMSQSSMKVHKTTVTVLDQSSKVVSIAEEYSYQQVADREDRTIEDGATVMEYVQ